MTTPPPLQMKDTRHLKVYSLAMNEIELKQCGWQYSVEPFSNIIIPTPLSSGGCVIIGMETITYYNKNFHKSISLAKVSTNFHTSCYILYSILHTPCCAFHIPYSVSHTLHCNKVNVLLECIIVCVVIYSLFATNKLHV